MYIIAICFAVLFLFWRNKQKSIYNLVGNVFVILILFIGALRDASIGTDIALYDDGYYMLWANPFNYPRDLETGFVLLTALIKWLSPSYYFYYSIIYVITILLFCYASKRLGINHFLFLALILLGGLLGPCFNVIRQMLALSIGLSVYAIFWAKDIQTDSMMRVIKYEIAIIVTGFLFHQSLYLLTIVPIFRIKKVFDFLNKDIVLFILLGIAVFIIVAGGKYINLALLYLEGRISGRAEFWVNTYAQAGDTVEATHGYMTTLLNGVVAILLSRKNRDIFFMTGFLGLLFSGVCASGLGTIGRAFDNLTAFLLLFWAKNWFQLYKSFKLRPISYGLLLSRIVLWISSLYYTLLLNESLNPYKTFLDL